MCHLESLRVLFTTIDIYFNKVPVDKPGDGPEKKITRLAIGVEGGFDPAAGKKFRFEEFYNIVILPSFTQIQWPNMELPNIVSLKKCLNTLYVHFILFL